MKKELITISIEAANDAGLNYARQRIFGAIGQAERKMNNGAMIKKASCNANDPNALSELFGQIKWWSLGRGPVVDGKKKEGRVESFLRGVWNVG